MSYLRESIDKYLDQTLLERFDELHIPGMGLAVIADNEIKALRGYGYRDLENKLLVDKDTMFAIGSSSKAFTAAILAQLVDEGRLNWTDRVRDIIPEFRLQDPIAEAEMNIIDLQCHRGGMSRADVAWAFLPKVDRHDLLKRMRHFPVEFPFRTRFSYNNYMWLAAGIVAERVTGKSWEELVTERIFKPLGMRANCSVDEMAKLENRAIGYADENGSYQRLDYHNIDAMGPAGSINASIEDYARWLLLNTNKGKFNDQQIISEENMEQVFHPHTPITPDNDVLQYLGLEDLVELKSFGYGLGWFHYTYKDHRILAHGGNIDGFSAWLMFMPDDGIGAAVLTNADQNLIHHSIVFEIFDRLLGVGQKPWVEKGIQYYHQMKAMLEDAKGSLLALQAFDTHPSHPLEDYCGTYQHPGYGELVIEMEDGLLVGSIWEREVTFKHFHYDTFMMHLEIPFPETDLPVTFHFAITGLVKSLSMPLEEGLAEIEFVRIPEEE
ncbi:MAG: serine hydrolase [Anaerolineaceae bacterium]|nr:serine hydrolase [Anaerolineaceae bacterium]